MAQNQKQMANIDAHVQIKVAKALENSNQELKKKMADQMAEIEKLREHNRCYKETIEYLES